MAHSLELIASYHLAEKDTDKQITDEHIEVISRTSCSQWKSLPAHLGLPLITARDIDRGPGDEREKRNTFLTTWKAMNGSKATYKKLISALLKIECREDAESVCELLKNADSMQQPESDFPSSNTSTFSDTTVLVPSGRNGRKKRQRQESSSESGNSNKEGESRKKQKRKEVDEGEADSDSDNQDGLPVTTKLNEASSDSKESKEVEREDALQVDSEDPEDSMEHLLGLSCFDTCCEDEESGGYGLVLAKDVFWRKKILKVHFISFLEQRYGDQDLTREMIIDWMNEWRGGGGEKSSVPMFVLIDELKGSDIRIEFSDTKCETLEVGNNAENRQGKVTMYLKLQDGPEDAENAHHHKKYTVLHETGHALGFYHEQQHPDITSRGIFNKDIVIQDLPDRIKNKDKFYDNNFGKLETKNNNHPFNNHGVMMYRVKKSWIREEFHEQLLRDKRVYKYGSPLEEFYWPKSALTGNLTEADEENAQKEYEEFFQGGAGVGGGGDEVPMDTDSGAGGSMGLFNEEIDSGAEKLGESDFSTIKKWLQPLSKEEIVEVGVELGLNFNKIKGLTTNEIIMKWLNQDDYVAIPPTRNSLKKALKNLKFGVWRNIN